jgi:ATP-dependent helicase HrpA
MAKVQLLQQAYEKLAGRGGPGAGGPGAGGPDAEGVARVRWMIEELRVSSFAQMLGTPAPVSEKRIWKAIDELGG